MDMTYLCRLETTSWSNEVPKGKESQRRHAFHDGQLCDANIENFTAAIEVTNTMKYCFFRDMGLPKSQENGIDLVNDQLKPNLIALMNTNEHHFVMSRSAKFGRLAFLSAEDHVKPEISRIVYGITVHSELILDLGFDVLLLLGCHSVLSLRELAAVGFCHRLSG